MVGEEKKAWARELLFRQDQLKLSVYGSFKSGFRPEGRSKTVRSPNVFGIVSLCSYFLGVV